jgi:hypothetical protein
LGEFQLNKLKKKILVIFMSLTFIMSGITVVSGVSVNKEGVQEELPPESDITTKTVTLYRCGLDGSTTPVQVEIELEEGQDLDDAMFEKCGELFQEDEEFQSLADDDNDNVSRHFLTKVRSRGRGLHIKLKPRIQLVKKFKIFPLLPPYLRTAIFIPTIICQYKNDAKAFTITDPLLGNKTATRVDGPQKVFAVGFIGFKCWLGHISFLGAFIRTGFWGVALYTKVTRLE